MHATPSSVQLTVYALGLQGPGHGADAEDEAAEEAAEEDDGA